MQGPLPLRPRKPAMAVKSSEDPQGPPSSPSPRAGMLARVVSFRVAVKVLARAVLELADTGNISEELRQKLRQVARGKS